MKLIALTGLLITSSFIQASTFEGVDGLDKACSVIFETNQDKLIRITMNGNYTTNTRTLKWSPTRKTVIKEKLEFKDLGLITDKKTYKETAFFHSVIKYFKVKKRETKEGVELTVSQRYVDFINGEISGPRRTSIKINGSLANPRSLKYTNKWSNSNSVEDEIFECNFN